MLVIADSTPLHTLIEIGHSSILPAMFEQVTIPPQVAAELSHARTPRAVREFVAKPPAWLQVRSPAAVLEMPGLDLGERAAISLGVELHPDFMLIDERAGRQAALSRGLVVIGTVGILERAARSRLLDLRGAFAALRLTRFHVSDALLEEVLRRHEASRE